MNEIWLLWDGATRTTRKFPAEAEAVAVAQELIDSRLSEDQRFSLMEDVYVARVMHASEFEVFDLDDGDDQVTCRLVPVNGEAPLQP